MNKQILQVILILLFLSNGIVWAEDTTLPCKIYISQPLQTKITDTMKVRVSVWNPTDQTQSFQGDVADEQGKLILSGSWDIILEEIKEGNVIFSRSLKKNDLSSIPQYLEANGNKNWEWQVAASDLTDHLGNYRFQLKYKNLTYTGQLFRVINNLKTPEHIDIQYVTNKKTYFIGEPISLKFVIKNNGKDDFIFDTGSDYRGASRHLRFYFTATNEKGSKAIDPKPNQNWMGGLGGSISLEPGEDHEIELPLLAYLKFLTPGSYTIKGYQALGFGEPDKTIPNGSEYGMEWEYTYGNTFNITIRKPDSADIENFIQTQLLIKDIFEEQRGFSYVYDPSYLQPLLRTLKSESDEDRIKALLTGIGSILTVESTQQLIALSQDDRMAVRTNALQQLFMRMPSKPNSNLSVERLKPFWRKYEIEQAWEESLRSQITKAGIIQKSLKSQSLAEVNAIARIVSLQGDPNMMPLLAHAADRIAPDIPASKENAQTINNLAGAAYSLYAYGYVPIKVDKHSSPGRLVIWANSVLLNKELHTEQWENLLLHMMSLDCNLTQYHAIRWLPDDFKQTDHIPWEKLMSAQDHQVWWYTIQSARQVKPSRIREIATKVLNETEDKEKQRNIKELLEEISQTDNF